MASRMERYYEQNIKTKKRSVKNVDLYKSIYETGEYSNIEGIATIEKTNEIDISKIQELLKQREEEKKQNVIPIVKKVEPVYEPEEVETRNYDIRDVLNKAKNEKEPDNKARKLRNTEYNILKNINLREVKEDSSEKELKQLIHTLTNNDLISKLKDDELSLDVLSDLKTETNIKTEPKKEEDMGLDKSFFTSSLNFGKDDFEELSDMKKSIKKNNKLIKILVLILILLLIGVGIFIFHTIKK